MAGDLHVCLLNDSFPPLIDGVANTVVNYATIIQRDLGRTATTSLCSATGAWIRRSW